MSRSAVFLDRDGVIIRDVDLLTRQDQVELYAYAPQAIQKLHASGFVVVVISNQPVVARGLATEQDVEGINSWIQQLLQRSNGTWIDRFYYCPHHPNANLVEYRQICQCRKPMPGMLMQAARELDLELATSYMVGDRISDIVAGARAGCVTILVQTGMHLLPPIEFSPGTDFDVEPNYICADLAAAVQVVLGAKQ